MTAKGTTPEKPDWIELQRIIPLREVERLSSLSIDTLTRRHRDKILTLSPRRVGMRLGDALNLKQQG
jgi:hypothetical protein